jgi:tripartite-type tricarboxylate transporter receptor subunit TctC
MDRSKKKEETPMKTRIVAALLLLLPLAAPGRTAAAADAYPEQPIHIVVPSGAGGITDTLARVLAEGLSKRLKQSVVVENKPGASGIVGSSYVARSKPDGYTLLMNFPSHVVNPSTNKHLPYDTAKDFQPVTKVGSVSEILLVPVNSKIQNLKALLDDAKKSPGKLTYGSVGVGSLGDLATLFLQSQAGVKMLGVTYKGEPQVSAALIRGDIDIAFSSLPAALPMMQAGKVKALAISDKARSPSFPDVPTVAEAGLPGYEVTGWNAIFVPAKTPKDIVKKLNGAINDVLTQPEITKKFLSLGVRPIGCSPEQLQQSVVADIASISKALKAAGVQPQ